MVHIIVMVANASILMGPAIILVHSENLSSNLNSSRKERASAWFDVSHFRPSMKII